MALLYIRTLPGMLKVIQLLFNLVAFICILATSFTPRGDAFLVASIGAFILTALIFVIRILDIDLKINLPFMRIEFIYCIVWSIFYIITSGLVIDMKLAGYIAGGVFGLLATVAYLIDAYHKFSRDL